MRRLFKEVFKSLSKNKVTLICLTILIFLTTFLFTLLNDVKTSYASTINAYDKVSRLHDLITDLDVNPSGIAPKSGFNQIGSDNVTEVKEPVVFESLRNDSNISYSINLPEEDENYIKLKNKFDGWDVSDNNYYIRTEDFMRFAYESKYGISSVNFEIIKDNPNFANIRNFSFQGNDRFFNLYKKENGKFQEVLEDKKITANDQITLVRDISLGQFLNIAYSERDKRDVPKNSDYIYSSSPLFINTETKQASFSTIEYDKWKAEGTLATIFGEDVLSILGFEKTNGRYVFNRDKQTSADIKLQANFKTDNNKIDPNDKIQKTFNLANYLKNHELSSKSFKRIPLAANKTYRIPDSWIRKTETKVFYNWYRYVLNWDEIEDENSSNWKGSYLKFISELKQKDPRKYREIGYFSYWNKTIETRYQIGNQKSKVITQVVPIEREDLAKSFAKSWSGGKENKFIPNEKANNEHTIYSNIKQIEFKLFGSTPNNEDVSDEDFNAIINSDKFKEQQEFVRDSATNFAKTSIINDIRRQVGSENLGIRQSLTVESIEDKTTKKNVFHFINTGDNENRLLGIKQNVGKLFNETLNPSLLSKSVESQNIDSFILKPELNSKVIKKIPPVYTLSLIDSIFKAFTPDTRYFNADIRFVDYYDFLPNTKIPYLINGKILILTKAADEPKGPNGASIVGAIAMPKQGQYILLQKSEIPNFNSNKVWNKVIKNRKESFTLKEIYDYLVKEQYTIRGEIGKNGWAKIDPFFKNSISLPLVFGSVSNELTQEIIQKKTINGLIEKIKEIILKSDFKNVFDKDDANRILNALTQSVQVNGFHNLLAAAKTNQFILEKVVFDTIKYIIKPANSNIQNLDYPNTNANVFIKRFLNKIVKYLKNQYESGGLSSEKRDQYLLDELKKISRILNISNIYVIPQLKIRLVDLFDFIKDKNLIFDAFSDIINSIDFIKFSAIIQDWYKNHPYAPFTRVEDTYWTLSSHRATLSFIQSIDEYQLKIGLGKIIDSIDFKGFLDPESSRSIYQKWLSANEDANVEVSEENKQTISSFFKKIDANKNGSYNNINEGLKELISNVSFSKFADSLSKLIKTQKSTITANNRIYNDYRTEILSQADYLAAFLSSLSSAGNDISHGKINQIQQAIIKILNLSSKTRKIVSPVDIVIPDNDPDKISIFDLLGIQNFNFPDANSNNIPNVALEVDPYNTLFVDRIISKTKNAIRNKTLISLTSGEYKFIVDYVLANNFDLRDPNKILEKLEIYRALLQKIQIKNYKSNGSYSFSNGEKAVASYGDLAFRSAVFNDNPTVRSKNHSLLKIAHSALENFFVSKMIRNDNDVIKNEFVLYSFWIKLAYYLNKLGEQEEKIIIDPETNERYIQKNFSKKHLTYDQIRQVLISLFELSKDPEIIKEMANYDAVINQIPGFGFLGGSDSFLKIAYSNAHTSEANKKLIELINNGSTFNKFFSKLQSFNISAKTIEEIKNILLSNSNELSYNFGYIVSADQMPTFYLQSLTTFLNSFLKTSHSGELAPLIDSDYTFDIIYKQTLEASSLPSYLSLINVPRNLFNPFAFMSFPQIVLYYFFSPNPNQGNLAYIVTKILNNLQNTDINDLRNEILAITKTFDSNNSLIKSQNDASIALDFSFFNHIINSFLKLEDGSDLSIFGINITKITNAVFDEIIDGITVSNLISYSDSSSYFAKVNYGYLNSNNKEVYTGKIDDEYLKNPYLMQLFIDNLDDKYKIRINTQEYLIVGIDGTADYLYPVVNEENIQVDTNTQAIVYVNDKGFDRIRSAYPTFALKTYALIKSPTDEKGKYLEGKSPTELKNNISQIINDVAPGSLKKVFLRDEQDSINPERYIRVVTVRSIVSSIQNTTIWLIIILTILVAFIVYFIIKRYIEARNKVVGILRAQGYKTGEIALSFSVFGWIPAGIGGLFGYIFGFALQRPTMQILSSYWTLEQNIIPFSALGLLGTILIPLVFVSLIIFVITVISVNKKATELMNGLTEVAVGNVARRISSIFKKLPIKMRYIASMALNNFWKMFSLFLSFSTTSLISMFFLSSTNVFNRAISKTYEDRLYKFKLDLESPTTEGGPYVTYDKSDLNALLYIPNDLSGGSSANGSQLDYNNPNFLRPGASFNTDVVQRPFSPTVITKSSLDILLGLSVELSPWDITYANMPETQRARVAQIFKRISFEMQKTQNIIDLTKLKNNTDFTNISPDAAYDNLIAVKNIDKFIEDFKAGKTEDLSNRTSYFFLLRDNLNTGSSSKINQQFNYVEWDPINQIYLKPRKVETSRNREDYRNFLINAYNKVNGIDFFVSFGGVYWNDATNEKYTYASGLIDKKESRIYGYYKDSRFISLKNSYGENLINKLYDYQYDFNSSENQDIPVILNEVASKRHHLGIGSKFSFDLLNHADRFSHKALGQTGPKTQYTFKVIGISETYINSEFVSRKDVLDHILGYDTLTERLKAARIDELNNSIKLDPQNKDKYEYLFNRKYDAFNGILSNDNTPVQTIDTLTTYSSTGFWGAASSFDIANYNDADVWELFKNIFISDKNKKYTSVFEHNVNAYNEAHPDAKLNYLDVLKSRLSISEADIENIISSKPEEALDKYKNIARETLLKFYGTQPDSIYGKNVMYGASFDVNSKDIEVGFISEISKTVNTILVALIIISLIISVVILVAITNIMIASNKRAIAIFSVLGYTNKEKIMLFFSNFIPSILMACLLMIPITLSIISIFNAFLMATSQIVLPLALHVSTIILSAVICLSVFAITSIITWKSLNKVKAVDALKGK
ncbi:FtsX-like permease family protein [Mycoplasma phocoeninasale]|uniref:FtsX-like permease family protein n=1 Tax=Mycoplasma phocoeninasale TaxID=2726117 RepID=UPI001967B7C3|nr:FtsX-like permease family protein [Mycoplasma phocoeninasale]MBN0970606.1 ABC transporter permease [Mycoplasma phocoeninasale]